MCALNIKTQSHCLNGLKAIFEDVRSGITVLPLSLSPFPLDQVEEEDVSMVYTTMFGLWKLVNCTILRRRLQRAFSSVMMCFRKWRKASAPLTRRKNSKSEC
jgi:hypothetical protein